MNVRFKTIVVALSICAANLASAQLRPRAQLPDDLSLFVAQPAVRDDLQLNETQQAAVTKLGENALKVHEARLQPVAVGAEARKARAELVANNEKALKELLEPKQLTRLNEIRLQYRLEFDWFATFRRLSEQLALTEEQKAKLSQLRSDLRAAHASKLAGTKLEDFDKKSRAVHKEEATEAVKLLTAEQQQKFADLLGKEFDLTKIDDYYTPTAK